VCGGVLVALLRSRPRTPDEPTTHEPTTHVDDASHST